MTGFTPLPALAGGILIGLAAVWLLYANGRLAAVSGIAADAVTGESGDRAWRWLFLVGLLGGVWLHRLLGSEGFQLRQDFPWWLLVASGLLVGVGTRIGAGCTSGHGVCGIARLSPRSLVATAVFMATAIVTVALVRHVWGIA